jgi:hypothetical protein
MEKEKRIKKRIIEGFIDEWLSEVAEKLEISNDEKEKEHIRILFGQIKLKSRSLGKNYNITKFNLEDWEEISEEKFKPFEDDYIRIVITENCIGFRQFFKKKEKEVKN